MDFVKLSSMKKQSIRLRLIKAANNIFLTLYMPTSMAISPQSFLFFEELGHLA